MNDLIIRVFNETFSLMYIFDTFMLNIKLVTILCFNYLKQVWDYLNQGLVSTEQYVQYVFRSTTWFERMKNLRGNLLARALVFMPTKNRNIDKSFDIDELGSPRSAIPCFQIG